MKVNNHPAKFRDHRHSGSRDKMVFVCHVTFQDHVIRALFDFIIRSPSRYVTIVPRLVAIGTVVLKIYWF